MERVSRRKLLAAGGTAVLAGAVVSASSVAAQATQPGGIPKLDWNKRYALAFDQQRSDSLRQASGSQAPTGPVYWTGTIWTDGGVGADGRPTADAKQVGVWRASGWVYVPGAAPQFTAVHSLDFAGRGQLIASGVTDSSVAVTGGTGDFQNARGEIRMANIGNGANAITIELDLSGPSIGR